MSLTAVDGRRPADFYDAYLTAVGAPEWHGHNLDALWDSLTGGDINQRNPTFHIQISGSTQMGDDARELLHRFKDLISDASTSGPSVGIELLP